MNFKATYPDLKQRREEFKKLTFSSPNMIPVILEPSSSSNSLTFAKFLVPKAYTFQEFQFNIRKKLKCPASTALFFIINGNHLAAIQQSLLTIYKEHKDPDGFLYINYSVENAYGSM